MKGIDYVFHVTALNQVQSCEFFPMEPVRMYVLGCCNVMNAALGNGVLRVILMSTHKAEYPIKGMGMLKELIEKVIVAKSRNLNGSGFIFC